MTKPLVVRLEVPPGWQVSPRSGTEEFLRWRKSLAADDRPATTMSADMDAFDDQVAASADDGRLWLVALTPNELAKRIIATGWIRQVANSDLDIDALEPLVLAATPRQGIDIVSQQMVRSDSGGHPSLLIYQLFTSSEEEGPHLCERLAAVTLFDDLNTLVQIEICTADLLAFENLAEFGSRLVGSISLISEGQHAAH